MIFDATKTVQVWSPKVFRFSTWGGGGVLESRRNRHRYVYMYLYVYIYLFIVYYLLFQESPQQSFYNSKTGFEGFYGLLLNLLDSGNSHRRNFFSPIKASHPVLGASRLHKVSVLSCLRV